MSDHKLGEPENSWRQAALLIGEHLSPNGPNGYYHYTPELWRSWALPKVLQLEADLREARENYEAILQGTQHSVNLAMATARRQALERLEARRCDVDFDIAEEDGGVLVAYNDLEYGKYVRWDDVLEALRDQPVAETPK